MHDFQHILGVRVKEERKKRGLTQAQLAECVHSNKRTILDIEKGHGNPKLETLFALLTFLEIDPFSIFYSEPSGRSSALLKLERQLHDCSEEQIEIMNSICEAVLDFSYASERIAAT